jgi:electron transfer flavoprotein alpha subunit
MSGILIIAEHRQGEIRPVSLEMVSAALTLKDDNGGNIMVAIIGSDPQQFVSSLSVQGVDEIITVQVAVNEFQPDIYEATVRGLIDEKKPSLVLIPHSVDAWGYAPTLGANGDYGFTTDVFGLRYEEGDFVATRAAYKEKVHIDIDFPGKETVVVTVRAGSYKPAEDEASPAVSSFNAPEVQARSEHKQFIEPEDTGDIDITQSEFMLSIGRGISEENNVEQFSELAETVGATLGCSRPIADSGWLPKSRQVGQSGKTVGNCKLYIAMGISGSVQHMAGMKHVENIIAVNTDPEASIFHIAKYGIVADIFDIAEELPAHFE